MSNKIIVNLMLEADITTELLALLDDDTKINEFAQTELQTLMDGEVTDLEYGARLLGITIKKE